MRAYCRGGHYYAALSAPIGSRPVMTRSVTSQVISPTAAVPAPSAHTPSHPALEYSAVGGA
jgi:hypothetical protein